MHKKVKTTTGQALKESTFAYMSTNGKVQYVKTAGWDRASDVWRIEDVTTKLIGTTATLFTDKVSESKHRILVSELGNRLLNTLQTDFIALHQHYPCHVFNPYVQEFIKLASERGLLDKSWLMHARGDHDIARRLDALNGFVDAIRQIGNSPEFKKTISDFERSSNKNYRELCKFIDANFELHSRLLVLRIDFGYKKSPHWPSSVDDPVSYEGAIKHRKMLQSYLSKSLPPKSFVNWACKMEYGLDKKWHFHVLMLLDGSIVREDVTIARMIGEFWNNTITQGKGLYWNCNAYKDNYKSCGIGMLNHNDSAAREGLKKAALYMTKIDYYVKLLTPGNGRIFWKGNMPKPKVVTVGRPRTRIHDQLESNLVSVR